VCNQRLVTMDAQSGRDLQIVQVAVADMPALALAT
jgi:hypothetical protein